MTTTPTDTRTDIEQEARLAELRAAVDAYNMAKICGLNLGVDIYIKRIRAGRD